MYVFLCTLFIFNVSDFYLSFIESKIFTRFLFTVQWFVCSFVHLLRVAVDCNPLMFKSVSYGDVQTILSILSFVMVVVDNPRFVYLKSK